MNIQQIIKAILSWIYINIWDEEVLGLHFELIALAVVKPFVCAYVCGMYAASYKNKIVELITPTIPEFTTSV